MQNKKLQMILMCVFTLTLVSCNTIQGAGKDIKAVGSAIEDAADRGDD